MAMIVIGVVNDRNAKYCALQVPCRRVYRAQINESAEDAFRVSLPGKQGKQGGTYLFWPAPRYLLSGCPWGLVSGGLLLEEVSPQAGPFHQSPPVEILMQMR